MSNETRLALSENFFGDISLSFFKIFKYVLEWLDNFRVPESNIFTIGEKSKVIWRYESGKRAHI